MMSLPQEMVTRPARADVEKIWLPYTLRWPSLLATIAFTCLIEVIVIIIHSISWRNSGLAADDGSGIFQIGSKFVPTLVATIYVFLASILLEDVKRTEPFARLSSPGGALADLSVSWTANAWWDTLFSSFPSRRQKTSWALLCATLAFVLGFAVISPLSSSLIVSQTVVLSEQKPFFRLNISPSMPIQAKPLSETYFRSISSVIRNVSTSAWISDQYAVLPFWPASLETAPLGPILFDTDQTWTGTTSVFSTELSCEPMALINISNTAVWRSGYGYSGKMAILSPQKDCPISYQYTDDEVRSVIWYIPRYMESVLFFTNGGGTKVRPSCSQDEYRIIISTSPETTVFGEACKASYFLGDSVVTVSLVNGQSIVKIDEQQYQANRKPILSSVANISTFQDAFLSSDWSIHMSTSDVTKYSHQAKGRFAGPGNLLAAMYDFSPDQIRTATSEQRRNITQRIKGRFFGELLLDCFTYNRLNDPAEISGAISTSPRRLLVVSSVAITLEVVLLIIIVLLSAVLVLTRPTRRPLGLNSNPDSSMSIAKLLSDDTRTIQSFMNLPTTTEAKTNALKYWYGIRHGKVRLIRQESLPSAPNRSNAPTETQTQWGEGPTVLKGMGKSTVFVVWQLVVLVIILIATMITVLTLYIYSRGHKLYQKAFVYTVSVSFKGVDLGDANPASILTTLVAVVIGLWWGSLDTNLRRAQPFLALAMGPVVGSKGTCISYNSSYLLWASVRAVRRKHWLLFLVSTGAFLSQIREKLVTIAMSSLWSRQPGEVSMTMQIPKTLELRHVPILSRGRESNSPRGVDRRSTALSSLFGNLRTSWMYGATVQLSLNGPEPPWSSRGWNFVPIDLALASPRNASTQNTSINNSLSKVTLETPAIRGRLDCSEYNSLDNTSFWMADWRLPKNAELSPNISHGYELKNRLNLNMADFTTTLFSSDRRLQCCQNMTSGSIGQSSIGYWSPNLMNEQAHYPHISKTWPANFTVKWIRGHAVQATLSYPDGTQIEADKKNRLIWTERPQMMALNCMPIIETADASVTVDAINGRVVDFKLLGQPQNDKFAWTDDFLVYKQPDIGGSEYDVNMTTSHGILFILGLLGAADLENFIGATTLKKVPGGDYSQYSGAERLEDQTFNIRDPGLNVDYMTYAMLSQANNNHSALLDAKILKETAQRIFSTFFQHFVNNKISTTDGGYSYQSPNEKLAPDIGEPQRPHGNTSEPPPMTGSDDNDNGTDGMAQVSTSLPMEILSMSEPAALVCILILGYLIMTCMLLAIASRSYNRLLLRQVNSISDVAFLVAGSNKLLNTAREGSSERLKYDNTVEAKLDWFVTENGDLRWGIEIVDELKTIVRPAPSTTESTLSFIPEGNSNAEEGVSWHDTVVSQIMAVGR